jgi:tetratricopeptide (TPR) repeat protein
MAKQKKKIEEKKVEEKIIAHQQHEPSSTLTQFLQWVASPLLLSIVGFLFYRTSLNYAFQFDDLANITKFYSIRHATFKELFFGHSRWVSSWINATNYRMGANDPFAPFYYRLTNISFHILTTVFLFFVFFLALKNLRQKTEHHSFFRTNAWAISFFSALLFLLHPAQTQAVSYVIQGRLEGIMGWTLVSMSLCFLLFCFAKNGLLKALYASLLCALAAFSCGTKEAAIVGPALIMLLDWFFVAQGEWSSFVKRIWLHILVSGIVAVLFLYYLKPQLFIDILSFKREMQNNIGNTITESRTDAIKPLHYLISEFKVIIHYLWIYLWPFNISVDYDWKMVSSFWAPDCILPFLLLVSIGAFVVYLLRKNKTNLFAFGLLWFFIAIAPRASIAASTELLADYKTYLSSVGWLFVLASTLVYLALKLGSYALASAAPLSVHSRLPVQMAALVLFSLPLGFATHERNKVWRSGEEFWANVLKNAPGRARAYNNYGVALSEKGNYAGAIPYFKKAASMDAIYPDPLNNLAVAHSVLGNVDEAIIALKQSLKINPYYPEAYNNLASFLLQKGDLAQAEQFLQVALKLRPYYGKAYYNLGRVYADRASKASNPAEQRQLLEVAWQNHRNACTIADFDNNVAGLNEYAKFSFQLQKYSEAVIALKKMLQIDPSLTDPLFALGNAYYFLNDFESARSAYYQLAQQIPHDARAWNNLGETCYQLQQFEAAVQFLGKAVALNPQLFNAQLRVAESLSRIGRSDEAKRVLEQLANANVPQEIKNAAKLGLAQLQNSAVKASAKA